MTDAADQPSKTKIPYIQNYLGLLTSCTPAVLAVVEAMKRQEVGEFSKAIREHYFPESDFVGAYEKAGITNGVPQEQWLYKYRDLIQGRVLNMSGSSHWNKFIYKLDKVQEVLISDLSEEVIEKLGHTTKTDVIGDFCAEQPPMDPESVNTILCLSILEHCDDPFQMISNLGRVLCPGGNLFVMCPFAYTDGHMSPDNWRFCSDGYKLLARKAGLDVIEVGEFGDYSGFASITFGLIIGNQGNRGIPWMNWMICRKPL